MGLRLNGQIHQDDLLILEIVRAFREGKNYGDLTFKFKEGILISGSEHRTFKAIMVDKENEVCYRNKNISS